MKDTYQNGKKMTLRLYHIDLQFTNYFFLYLRINCQKEVRPLNHSDINSYMVYLFDLLLVEQKCSMV